MLKILVAEDEPEILRLYKLLLEDEGYEVFTTIDGQECVDKYKAELEKTTKKSPPFDLVLLDHRMPKKNGAETAIELLTLCPTQRLLMVTVYAGHLDLQVEKLKTMEKLEKPFDPDELLSTISKLLNS